jgi:hypothetical protein
VKHEERGPAPTVKPTTIFTMAADLPGGEGGTSLSPDGRRLAVAHVAPGSNVTQYDTAAWKRKELARVFRPSGLCYAGDSERLYVGCNSALAVVRARGVERVLLGPSEMCLKGSRLASANPADGVGNTASGAFILSPDGKYLLVTEVARNFPRSGSGSVDPRRYEAIVYDSATGEEAAGVLPGAGPKGMARFSKDGSRLASFSPGYGEGFPPLLELWDTSRLPWKKIRTFEAQNIYPPAAPSFSPDNRYVAGGGQVFELESGLSVHRTNGPALFDSLGRFLMTWDSNGRGLAFLRVGDWRKFDELMLEQSAMRRSFGGLEISADGRILVGVVTVWQGLRYSRSFTRIYTRGEIPDGRSKHAAGGM